jgi:methanol---5-hydroxybenzimidazolylcobamide Co-methyltransferase
VLKAITGCPISMEGKSATCAHFSPVGNIAAAACDLWSNESVQNVRLLSGNAPEAYAELLVYDCRLMNAASARGQALMLREWMTESDEWLSPQAAVLSPEATLRIARAVVSERDPYRRTVEAGMEAVGILQQGLSKGCLKLSAKERTWLDRIERELGALPPSAVQLRAEVEDTYGKMYAPASYGWE